MSVGLQEEEATRERVGWGFLVILKPVVLARGRVRLGREAGKQGSP